MENNPMKDVDPDGREIRQYNYAHRNVNGHLTGKIRLSVRTQAAMVDFVKTTEGFTYISKYAFKGDIVGGYKFDTYSSKESEKNRF